MDWKLQTEYVLKGTRKIIPWKIAPPKIAPNPNPNPNSNPNREGSLLGGNLPGGNFTGSNFPVTFLKEFSSHKVFWLDMRNSLHKLETYFAEGFRIPLLSLNVRKFESVSNNSALKYRKQSIIKLLLAYIFRMMLMLIMDQNSKQVYVLYSFHELLIYLFNSSRKGGFALSK